MQDGSMKIILKPNTVEKIEELANEKMTTRCDRVVNKALDAAMQNSTEENNPQNSETESLQTTNDPSCNCPNVKDEMKKVGEKLGKKE